MFKIELKQTEDTKKFLKQFPGQFRKYLVEGFRKATYYIEGEIKKSFGQTDKPKVRSGHLRRSITSTVTQREGYLVGTFGSDLIYAPVHEYGAVIKPKNKPFLRFQIGERWVTLKQVTIPARPYIEPAIRDNIDEVDNIIATTITDGINNAN